jgi:hypothetical protein
VDYIIFYGKENGLYYGTIQNDIRGHWTIYIFKLNFGLDCNFPINPSMCIVVGATELIETKKHRTCTRYSPQDISFKYGRDSTKTTVHDRYSNKGVSCQPNVVRTIFIDYLSTPTFTFVLAAAHPVKVRLLHYV